MKDIKFLFIFLLLLFLVKPTNAQFPEFPMTFYGTVKHNNSPVLSGSKIRAISNNYIVGEVEIKTDGIYGTTSSTGPNLSIGKYDGNSLYFYYITPNSNTPLSNVSPVIMDTAFNSGLIKEYNFNFSSSISISNGGGGGGGGGGSNIKYCSSISYSDWNTCSGNKQFRQVSIKTPTDCSLTVAQQLSLQQDCNDNSVSIPLITSEDVEQEKNENPDTKGNDNIKTIINTITEEASLITSNKLRSIINNLGISVNAEKETKAEIKYKNILGSDKNINSDEKSIINEFIVYGTQTTQALGEGERAAVVNSYFQAYGKLQNTEEEWSDLLKIAVGRWPNERNSKAEDIAKNEFKKVYGREANLKNNIDENAVMVVSYGLLPSQRNLNSEKAAIKAFKWVYNRIPTSALDWNIVRSIAYSGAKR